MTVKQFINLTKCMYFETIKRYGAHFYSYEYGSFDINEHTSIEAIYNVTYFYTPYIVCNDGEGISVQTHQGAHCRYEGVEQDISGYPTTCNLDPVMAETLTSIAKKRMDAIREQYSDEDEYDYCYPEAELKRDEETLNPYETDSMKDIEKWVERHGGINIDATIELMWKKVNNSKNK